MTEMREYLAAVRAALADVPARDRREVIAELEANLSADVERRGGNQAALAAALADLGEPEEYAAAVREALGVAAGSPQPQGRFLGMPYEFRSPTTARVMERLWNPSNPQIFMPRLWGMGWAINFGAIAVRLGLMRPDDVEQQPFENLSARALSLAIAVPATLGAVVLAVAIAFWNRLPAEVPMHFDAAGAADDWGPKTIVIGLLVLIGCGAPAVVFGWQAVRRVSRGAVAVTCVLLSLFSTLSVGILGYTVANAVYDVEGWWIGALILGSLVVPGVMLLLLAQSSLKTEWRAATEPGDSDPEEGAR